MTDTRKNKPISFQPDSKQAAAIKAWKQKYEISASKIIRVALNIGLRALNRDSSPLAPEQVSLEDISPPKDDLTDEVQGTRDVVGPVASEMAGEFEDAKSSRRAQRKKRPG